MIWSVAGTVRYSRSLAIHHISELSLSTQDSFEQSNWHSPSCPAFVAKPCWRCRVPQHVFDRGDEMLCENVRLAGRVSTVVWPMRCGCCWSRGHKVSIPSSKSKVFAEGTMRVLVPFWDKRGKCKCQATAHDLQIHSLRQTSFCSVARY